MYSRLHLWFPLELPRMRWSLLPKRPDNPVTLGDLQQEGTTATAVAWLRTWRYGRLGKGYVRCLPVLHGSARHDTNRANTFASIHRPDPPRIPSSRVREYSSNLPIWYNHLFPSWPVDALNAILLPSTFPLYLLFLRQVTSPYLVNLAQLQPLTSYIHTPGRQHGWRLPSKQ